MHLLFTLFLSTSAIAGPTSETSKEIRNWAFGIGGQYTYLKQGPRNFETLDEVKYSTTPYISKTASAFLSVQKRSVEFWRLSLALKQSQYKAIATKDVTGNAEQPISLEHNFISILLQRAWAPFPWKRLYMGLGGEVAKATSVRLKLSTSTLTTSKEDLPTYLGAQAFVGVTWLNVKECSFFAEFRYAMIPNQTPAIAGYELASGLLYWF